MNRRDLLKYFAAGTVIAPVSGSAPLAKLIEVPNVELVKAPRVVEPFDLCQVARATINFEMLDGGRWTMEVGDTLHYSKGTEPHRWIAPGVEYDVRVEFLKIFQSCPSAHTVVGRIQGRGSLA